MSLLEIWFMKDKMLEIHGCFDSRSIKMLDILGFLGSQSTDCRTFQEVLGS